MQIFIQSVKNKNWHYFNVSQKNLGPLHDIYWGLWQYFKNQGDAGCSVNSGRVNKQKLRQFCQKWQSWLREKHLSCDDSVVLKIDQ